MERSEAIEIIRKNWPDGRHQLREALETLIPELKESEDERIRKAIHIYLDWLRGRKDYAPRGEYSIGDMISWLEKQITPQVRTGIEWEDTIDDACDKIYSTDYNHGEYCHEQSFKWGFQEGVEWLEKQGSQNLANSAKTCKVEPKFKVGDRIKYVGQSDRCAEKIIDIKNEAYYFSEVVSLPFIEQDKWELVGQKPADMVEPKFKVGDWVVYNDDICQIVKREEGCNKLVTNFGIEKELVNERNLLTARFWTIQDAEDGDVLLSPSTPEGDKECPFIFKEIDEDGIVRYHAALLQSEILKIADGIINVMGYANAGYHIPATKEQYDLLFQKMKEAGYEWNAEKKELKKIEQNSTWSEDVEAAIRLLKNIAEEQEKDYCPYNANHLRKAAQYLETCRPQNTWKPTMKQLTVLSKAIELRPLYESDGVVLMTLYNDLNKLQG